MSGRVRMLEVADTVCHRLFDWYIDAEVRGRHLPGWGRLQFWTWHVCSAYDRAAFAEESDR